MKYLLNGSDKKAEILRWLVFSVMCLIPLIFLFKGVVRFCQGELLTLAFAVAFFLIPILIIIGFFYIIRDKNTHALGKSVLSILLVIVLSIISFVFVVFGTFKELHSYNGDKAVNEYSSIIFYESEAMPNLNETGDYEEIRLFNYKSYYLLGNSVANTVVLKYDKDKYDAEKQRIADTYIFQEESIRNTIPNSLIDDYYFKMLSIQDYCDYYPKHVRFVATNDKTNEIVHINFYDVELDYIESVEDFILNDCGFKYIK